MLNYLILVLIISLFSFIMIFCFDWYFSKRKFMLFANGEVMFFKTLEEMKLKVKADYEFENIFQYILVDGKYVLLKNSD